MSLKFVNIEEIKDAIADVRNDKTSTNWALLTYQGENSNDVVLLGKGEGGLDELISLLKDEIVGYGLVRLVERFDDSDTVKFVFVHWIGEKIHRMLRARKGTHSGAIKDILTPYHTDVEATTLSEISEEIVVRAVARASGTAVHVLEKSAGGGGGSASPSYSRAKQGGSSSPASSSSKGPSSSSKGPSSVPKQTDNVKFDEETIRAAIQDVRSDSTDTDWVLLTYDGPNSNNIILLGAGNGGSAELLTHLKDDNVAYGLVRQVEKFDDSNRVMFAYVNWVGENIHRMLRARLGTHSGAVKGLLAPYHADIDATNTSEISTELITTKIRETIGTATRVRG